MTKKTAIRSVAIIGPGRLGQGLGRLLVEAGEPIAFVAARRLPAARQASRFIGQGIPLTLYDARLFEASHFLITTSDSAIAKVAEGLSRMGKGGQAWKGKVVLHTSGALPSAVLENLKRRAAAVGSLHPYQTVPTPTAGVRNLRSAYWAVEGDPAAVALARRWVKTLGGVAFSIDPEAKALYHLSAFIVCPTVITLMAQAGDLLAKAGVPGKVARPMLRQFVSETARNFEDLGGPRALTGPAVRGDWETIRHHIAALKIVAPRFEPVYQSLLKAMLRLAKQSPKTT